MFIPSSFCRFSNSNHYINPTYVPKLHINKPVFQSFFISLQKYSYLDLFHFLIHTIMAESSDQSLSNCCFQDWMKLQDESQRELLQAIESHEAESKLNELIEQTLTQFQQYIDQRTRLAKNDVSGFLVPAWCTAWENSLLWVAGCRPSMFIRLVYSFTGLDLESRVNEFLRGNLSIDELNDLSPQQMVMLNTLQMKAIKEEKRLTSKLASLQEEIADTDVVMIIDTIMKKGEIKSDEDLEEMMKKIGEEMLKIIEEADKLRIRTLKEVIEILGPFKGVTFLAYSKKLQLCVHQWGKRKDQKHGRVLLS